MPSTAASAAPIDIAVGVVVNPAGRLLIAERRPNTPGAGYWEFPGGKREAGETALACLERELAEEIGITGLRATPLIRFAHDRGPRPVRLHVWRVHDWTGTPGGREGQAIRWVERADLPVAELLPATEVIIAALDLPRRYLLTPPLASQGRTAWLASLDAALAGGIRLLRLRDPALPADTYAELARAVIARAHAHGAKVLLDRDPDMVVALGADGLHWPARRLDDCGERPLGAACRFAVSAHDGEQLAAAARLGADFATLSPVVATASHPGAAPLGWPDFERLRADHALPVYALGGLGAADCAAALAHNAQGVAAIRGFWPGAAQS